MLNLSCIRLLLTRGCPPRGSFAGLELWLNKQQLEMDMGLYWPELTLLPHPLLHTG